MLLANADIEGSRAGGGDTKKGNIKKGTAGKKYQEEKEQEVCCKSVVVRNNYFIYSLRYLTAFLPASEHLLLLSRSI